MAPPFPFPVAFADADEPALDVLDALRADGRFAGLEVRSYTGVPNTAEEWLQRIGDARGLLLGWVLPTEALRQAPHLEVISYLGTGVSDHLDLQVAEERGIAVRTVTGYGNDAVAEHAIALLLSAWRQIPLLDRQVRAGQWPAYEARPLRGATLAVLGLGGIGLGVAHRAKALGMNVLGWTHSHDTGVRERDGIAVVSLEEALTCADAVSLHTPLNPHTQGLITAELLGLLRPGAVLVNTARGGLIDTAALLAALDDGRLAVAALDVFDDEPLPAHSPLRTRDDLVLTPHTAFNTTDATMKLFEGALANLEAFATGKDEQTS